MTAIEWTDRVWNPVRGCSIVSKGCRSCYAMKQAHRFSGPGGKYEGLTTLTNGGPVWTGKVVTVPSKLQEPLSWRKPQRVFVNSMSDLFHEDVPFEFIDDVFVTMAITGGHTFQILTKRPERMLKYATHGGIGRVGYVEGRVKRWCREHGKEVPTGLTLKWPLENVWLGVSVEDQATAKERIWRLLETPAAHRFVSYEPALGPVDLDDIEALHANWRGRTIGRYLDWVIVGGESGPGARPFDIRWARIVIEQCKRAETPVFVKQLGRRPFEEGCAHGHVWVGRNPSSLHRLVDRKGGDMSEWPKDLRVREFPT